MATTEMNAGATAVARERIALAAGRRCWWQG